MNETPDSPYKDSAGFTQASDYAQGNEDGELSGRGPGDASRTFTPAKGRQDWQNAKPEKTPPEEEAAVETRSDDPGHGSYGGFKDEGPATPDGQPKP